MQIAYLNPTKDSTHLTCKPKIIDYISSGYFLSLQGLYRTKGAYDATVKIGMTLRRRAFHDVARASYYVVRAFHYVARISHFVIKP